MKKIYVFIMEQFRKVLNSSAEKDINSKRTKLMSTFMDKVLNLHDKLFNDELKHIKNNYN